MDGSGTQQWMVSEWRDGFENVDGIAGVVVVNFSDTLLIVENVLVLCRLLWVRRSTCTFAHARHTFVNTCRFQPAALESAYLRLTTALT